MPRYLVAHLPVFRLERCGWTDDLPVILAEEERSALRVQCATSPALAAGIRRGMTVAEARALLPELAVERRDPVQESEDLADLAAQLLRLSPCAAPLGEEAIVVEIGRTSALFAPLTPLSRSAPDPDRGSPQTDLPRLPPKDLNKKMNNSATPNLFKVLNTDLNKHPNEAPATGTGDPPRVALLPTLVPTPDLPSPLVDSAALARAGGERALLERTRRMLARLGHCCRLAIADDPATALACARWNTEDQRVPPGQGPAALRPLPLAALGLPADDAALLHQLGLETIGDFVLFSPASLAGRLSPTGQAAHALARGEAPPILLATPEEETTLLASQDLPEPAEQLDGLLFVLGALLRELAGRLLARGEATTSLSLQFHLSGGRSQYLALRLGRASRDPDILLRLLRRRLERLQLVAPVERIVLEVGSPVPFDGQQRDLVDPHRASEALGEVVALLQDTLGESAVSIPRLRDRHRPEEAWEPQEPSLLLDSLVRLSPSTPGPCSLIPLRESRVRSALAADPVAEWHGFPETTPPPRPALLLSPPITVSLRTGSQGLPEALHHDGRWHRILRAHGPERRSGEWWTTRPFQRHYWSLLLDDTRQAWVYREDGRWILHGWWDGPGVAALRPPPEAHTDAR